MTSTVLRSLNQALHSMMEEDDRVYMVGEDLLDPYGGAFKVTRGLSMAFPDRVWTTPISEAGFVGVATGMALRGLRPVVEIMFGDFLTLACDQLVNHAAKFSWMYAEKVEVPLVVRAPMGGRRGYGPTHSQSLEKHFLGVPGLAVVAVDPFGSPGDLLRQAVADRRPLLFVENKVMYARRVRAVQAGRMGAFSVRETAGPYPTLTLSLGEFLGGDATVVAYGGMAELAVEAAEELLIEEERVVEVVIPRQLHPLDVEPVVESVGRTGRLVVCEEGSGAAGFGAEVVAAVSGRALEALQAAPRRVAALPVPIGNAPTLEAATLPGTGEISSAVRAVIGPARPLYSIG